MWASTAGHGSQTLVRRDKCVQNSRLQYSSFTEQASMVCCNARVGTTVEEGKRLPQRLLSGACAWVAVTTLSFGPFDICTQSALAESIMVSNDVPVLDMAKVVPTGRVEQLEQRMKQLEKDTGYRVRLLTRFGASDEPSLDELRSGWNTSNEKTVVAIVDPSSSNIMSFNYGLDVQNVLRRPYFTELQSRYGNLFYIREQGESVAVLNMMDSLLSSLEHPEECIAKGGCRVVPGVPPELYYSTLWTSIAGGIVVGFVNKLEPQGWVQRKWVWQLVFAPLWATLFINFGLGPIVSRTSDIEPVLGNFLGFAAAAALVVFAPGIARVTGLTESGYNSDR